MSEEKQLNCLNIGCGLNPMEIIPTEYWHNIDRLRDLEHVFSNEEPWKDKNISFMSLDVDAPNNVLSEMYGKDNMDYVVMDDVIEHLHDPLKVMTDIWRICKDGAQVKITIPYPGSSGSYADLTHKRTINEIALATLVDEVFEKNKERKTNFTPYKLDSRYNFSFSKVDDGYTLKYGKIESYQIILRANKVNK